MIRSHRAPASAWPKIGVGLLGAFVFLAVTLAVDPEPPHRARGPVAPVEDAEPPAEWLPVDPAPDAAPAAGEPRRVFRASTERRTQPAPSVTPRPVVVVSPSPRSSAPSIPPLAAPSPTPTPVVVPTPVPTGKPCRKRCQRRCEKHPDRPRCQAS